MLGHGQLTVVFLHILGGDRSLEENHALADISIRVHPQEDGPVVYPANVFDSRLRGD